MALYSSPKDIRSHRTRFVLAEKGISIRIVDVDPDDPPEDLVDLNPYHSAPTLVDRDLVLYGTQVVIEYLDERYPHPPLMPVDPVSRARLRLAQYRVLKDWYPLVHEIEAGAADKADVARARLADGLTAAADVFAATPYFLNEELTLVDCAIGPLLWRLPHYGIELKASARPVLDYADRLFALESFGESLSEFEREMR